MNDSICLVIAHANTNYRKKLLNECLNSIKTPIVLSTNYPVNEETQQLCDNYLYNKNNPLLYKEDYDKYNIIYNYWKLDSDGNKVTTPFEFEHGYAVYCLIKDDII